MLVSCVWVCGIALWWPNTQIYGNFWIENIKNMLWVCKHWSWLPSWTQYLAIFPYSGTWDTTICWLLGLTMPQRLPKMVYVFLWHEFYPPKMKEIRSMHFKWYLKKCHSMHFQINSVQCVSTTVSKALLLLGGFKVVFLIWFYRPTGIYTVVERINVHTLEWILYGLVWIGELWTWPLQWHYVLYVSVL